MATAPDPFIVITSAAGSQQPDAATRRYIRSHVMRGKNRKRPRHESSPAGSWINGQLPTEPHPAIPKVPRCLGTDVAFLQYAEDLSPAMQELVFQCLFSHSCNPEND